MGSKNSHCPTKFLSCVQHDQRSREMLHCSKNPPSANAADDLINAGRLRSAVSPRVCVRSGALSHMETLTSENASLDGEELVAA